MNSTSFLALAAGALTALMIVATPAVAGPETVAGPSADAGCFAPNSADTAFYKYAAKTGPYRIAQYAMSFFDTMSM